MTFSLSPSPNPMNLFENWLNGIAKNDKVQIQAGVCALKGNDFILINQEPLFAISLQSFSRTFTRNFCL
jgi:hypothetical protein